MLGTIPSRNVWVLGYFLTSTFCATSTVAIITTAAVASFSVSTVSVLVTVVQVIILTLINIFMKTERAIYSVSDSLYSHNESILTIAIQFISVQLVSCVTAADEAPNGVSTIVFTPSICCVTFINI